MNEGFDNAYWIFALDYSLEFGFKKEGLWNGTININNNICAASLMPTVIYVFGDKAHINTRFCWALFAVVNAFALGRIDVVYSLYV